MKTNNQNLLYAGILLLGVIVIGFFTQFGNISNNEVSAKNVTPNTKSTDFSNLKAGSVDQKFLVDQITRMSENTPRADALLRYNPDALQSIDTMFEAYYRTMLREASAMQELLAQMRITGNVHVPAHIHAEQLTGILRQYETGELVTRACVEGALQFLTAQELDALLYNRHSALASAALNKVLQEPTLNAAMTAAMFNMAIVITAEQ